ncbi:hypothetical protein WA026_012871 [Henosepilachna vigintioctopunctata]|uniref:Phage protein n=1 Tax=Henosepilachna vigintioctopunctata TaxID=420089 RepID=A0AAW1TS64_9CUCU
MENNTKVMELVTELAADHLAVLITMDLNSEIKVTIETKTPLYSKYNNEEYKTDKEKADIFAKLYKTVFKYDTDRTFDVETETGIENWYGEYFSSSEDRDIPIEIKETT